MNHPAPTDPAIVKLQKRIANMKLNLEAMQMACSHDDEVIRQSNNHDGYSFVEITWYETRRCKKCGRITDVITGKTRPGR